MKKNVFFKIIILSSTLLLSSCGILFPPSTTTKHSGSPSQFTTSYSSKSREEKPIEMVDGILNYNALDLAKHSYYSNVDFAPSLGNLNILVIPVKFTDSSIYCTSSNRTRIEKAFFGTQEETGWHSVKTYYEEESNNKLNINGVVSDWYNSGFNSQTISSSDTKVLAENAVKWYKTTYNSTCEEFDSDKNGKIDCVALIYGVRHSQSGNRNDTLWAFTSWAHSQTPSLTSPVPAAFIFASFDFASFDINHCNIDSHTYIHEFGHVLGLEDYYNYDDNSFYNAAGEFSMQDRNVGGHDPYSKLKLGWTTPILLNGTGTIDVTLTPSTEGGKCLVLTNKESNEFDSPFDEYLILEHYTPTGVNNFDIKYRYNKSVQGVNAPGIRIWHVDARLLKNFKSQYDRPEFATRPDSSGDFCYAMSNSTDSSHGSFYSQFRNYKLLHLIEACNVNYFEKGSHFTYADLFTAGKEFSLETYSSFFVNNGMLNSGENLDVSLKVLEVSNQEAKIRVTRN